jgi:shikimate dehydrogenase
MIKGTTKLLGVIGNPISHSLSPVMHNRAIVSLGLDYVYLPLPIKEEDLATAIAGFAAIDLVGFSVTIPHKQSIIPYLNEISDTARLVGAVNTVWRKETGWFGTNTDVEGFISPLQKLNRPWSQTKAVILGNGGAARAVVVGLAQLGCGEIYVLGRDEKKLDRFRQSWQDRGIQEVLKVDKWNELPKLVLETQLLVNSTPVGMFPKVTESPIEGKLMAKLPKEAIVYDLIYTPRPTLFLQQAQDLGLTTIDGLEMLVAQGAAALKIWLQRQDIPVDVMIRSLTEALAR